MLKEIFEQPRSIRDTFRGRLVPDGSDIRLGGLLNVLPRLLEARRIIILRLRNIMACRPDRRVSD
jgi:glutamine---fructose-6-phosphate transaminase (isomerizing)